MIGWHASHVAKEEASQHVAGHTITHVITARNIQALGEQILAMNFRTVAPVSPWLVPRSDQRSQTSASGSESTEPCSRTAIRATWCTTYRRSSPSSLLSPTSTPVTWSHPQRRQVWACLRSGRSPPPPGTPCVSRSTGAGGGPGCWTSGRGRTGLSRGQGLSTTSKARTPESYTTTISARVDPTFRAW